MESQLHDPDAFITKTITSYLFYFKRKESAVDIHCSLSFFPVVCLFPESFLFFYSLIPFCHVTNEPRPLSFCRVALHPSFFFFFYFWHKCRFAFVVILVFFSFFFLRPLRPSTFSSILWSFLFFASYQLI